MIKKVFQDIELSALGLGCMRLPVIDGNNNQIDQAGVEELMACAMEAGINYYDAAWGYHGGKCEASIGAALKKYPRESYYLATKFPGYDLSCMDKAEAIFEEQLKRCQVDYFDFYLCHNVNENNLAAYCDAEKFGVLEYLIEQKKQGRIHHLGFSTHGNLNTMKTFLDKYGKEMEFCQIQLNWLDWDFQNAKEKVALLKSYNIPIWVMEPVRGGNLAKLDETYEVQLKALRPEWTTPEWAFRFLQGIPEVTMVLSGMTNMQQLKENIHTFETEEKLSEAELDVLMNVAHQITSENTLPCTACRYCIDHCPQELNIPWFMDLYNEYNLTDGKAFIPMAFHALDESKKPAGCIGCQSCEAVCPQNIKISEMMKDFVKRIK